MQLVRGAFALFSSLFVLTAGIFSAEADNSDVRFTDSLIDHTRTCSLTIHEYASNNGDAVVRVDGNAVESDGLLPDGAVPVSGVGFCFMKIAEPDFSQTDAYGNIGPARFTGLSPKLRDLLSELKVLSSANLDKSCQETDITDLIGSANTVSASAVSEFIARYGTRLADTDEEGITMAEGLTQGLYLVAETKSPEGLLPCDPFCIALPRTNISEMSIGNNHYNPGELWLYDISVYPKSRSVTVQKAIVADEKNEKGEVIGEKKERSVTACIGDTVKFAIVADVPKLSDGTRHRLYVIEDEMDPGLSFTGDVRLALGENADTATSLTINSDYKLDTSSKSAAIRITFTKTGLARLSQMERESHVYVYYSARLDKNAVIADRGNVNSARLLYGTDHSDDIEVTSAPATVFTYMLTLKKTFSPVRDQFGDVRFSLSDGSEKMHFVKESDGSYHTSCADEENDQTTLVAPNDSTGILVLKGLANGTYILTEEETIPDYSLLGESIEITIRNRNMSVDVENKKSIDLVHTGGGGLVPIIFGAALMISVGSWIIFRTYV